MRVLNIIGGIGSMTIGAKQLGMEVVGNIEWRPYYHSETFEKNFPGAWMCKTWDDRPEDPKDIDIVFGHTECGNYSNLHTHASKETRVDVGDIPEYIEMVQKIKPKFFVMDNLPGSLQAVTAKDYHESFPGYDIFFEWVSNYHYGNTQKNRKRLFVIGAKKELAYNFIPDESNHEILVEDILCDLHPYKDIPEINHIHHSMDEITHGFKHRHLWEGGDNEYITYGEFRKYLLEINQPPGRNFPYMNSKGESKIKPGYSIMRLDHSAPVMTGGGSFLHNHFRQDTLLPLTIRERAKIQGCPDNFIFYPLDYMEDIKMERYVYKQTGKFMPVEFTSYLANHIQMFLENGLILGNGRNIIKPNIHIESARKWYSENVGYTNKDALKRYGNQLTMPWWDKFKTK